MLIIDSVEGRQNHNENNKIEVKKMSELFGNNYLVIDFAKDNIQDVDLMLIGYEPKKVLWAADYCVLVY